LESVKEIFLNARNCNLCYSDKKICVPLPDPKNAQKSAEIVFINERPGRIGTKNSGYISFENDDPSADFFKKCFLSTSIDRQKIFITNACLCFPDIVGYKDKAPTMREMKNCHKWLKYQFDLVQPKLIVTMGTKALQSVLTFFGEKNIPKLKDVIHKKIILNESLWIVPLYHTSRRGRANRSPEKQFEDWKLLPIYLTEINK
jgi:uracil-DNA glycosylase family 4